MKIKGTLIAVAFLSLLFTATGIAASVAKPLLVHYMPWFQTPYSLGTNAWGHHWKLGTKINPNGADQSGKRQIASWLYPTIGPYDSLDPAVLEYHVLLMKLGGIDGVIVDWYGPDNYYDYHVNNQRTLALFDYTRKAGLKFALCYEDATIPAEIKGGSKNGITVTASNAIAHAQQTLLYAQTHFFTDPSYLRLNNAPVFLNFGPQYFHNSADWTAIFSGLRATNQPAFFTEDKRLAAGQGAFTWPPMSLSTGSPPTLSSDQLESYLSNFESKARTEAWPVFISSAFPRFHDFYAQAGVGNSYGYLDDAGGNTLTTTLRRALTNDSAIVQIVTWNDFGEGTAIEPTKEYGYRDLGIVQDLRRQFRDAAFPYDTKHLALALRHYNLRKQHGNNPVIAAELDRIFVNIVSDQVATAELQLIGIESNKPVICSPTYNGEELQFMIGGYVAAGMQVQMSTNLTSWQTVQTFTASTNQSVFSINRDQNLCRFFKVL